MNKTIANQQASKVSKGMCAQDPRLLPIPHAVPCEGDVEVDWVHHERDQGGREGGKMYEAGVGCLNVTEAHVCFDLKPAVELTGSAAEEQPDFRGHYKEDDFGEEAGDTERAGHDGSGGGDSAGEVLWWESV